MIFAFMHLFFRSVVLPRLLSCFRDQHMSFLLQWNPVNKVTNGPKKFGRINEGFFFIRKCMAVLPGGQKINGRNNEVTVRRGFTIQ